MTNNLIASEDITCINCGWHWNTSDSDESDKYVCHKCGFDNKAFYDPRLMDVMADATLLNLKKNGILLRDKENTITLIAYNTENRETSTALYNKALIYKSVKTIRQANEIIEMLDNQLYEIFDESKIEHYKKSGHLIILNQNEVVYDSEKPDLTYADGGTAGITKIAEDVYISRDKNKLPKDATIVMHRYNDNIKAGELGLFAGYLEGMEFDSGYGENKAYISIGKNAKVKKILSTENYLDDLGELDKPRKYLKKKYGYDSLADLMDESGSLDNPSNAWYERQKVALNKMREAGEDFEVLEMLYEEDYIPHQYLITTVKNKDISFADGGAVQVPSTEDLIQLVVKERENKIREWYRMRYKVVVARNDGYSYKKQSERDSEFIDAKNPSKKKVLDIINSNPDLEEIRFNGTIKVGNRVGEGLEIADDFSVLLWKKENSYADGGAVSLNDANYGHPKVSMSDIPFIHETSKEISEKILNNGFIVGTNQNITKGVYTIPIVYKKEPFNTNNVELSIFLKPNSKIFWTNSKRPMDFYYGIGNEFFENLFLKLGGKKDDSNRVEFLRNFEKWLLENNYCGVQQGGEIVITDLACIDTIELFDRDLRYADGGVTEFNKKIQDRVKEIKEDYKYDGSEKDLSYVNSSVAVAYLQYLADSIGAKYYQWDFHNESKMPTNHFQIDMELEGGNILSALFVYVDDNHRVVKSKSNVKLLDEDYNTIKVLVEEPKFKSSMSEYSFEYKGITFEINRFGSKWMFFGKYFGYLQEIPQLEAKSKNELIIKIKRYLDVVLEYEQKDNFAKGGLSKTPAPKKDRVFGSDKNKVGSAASKESAKKINLSDGIITTLSNKAKEYNEENSGNKVTLNTLKAVMRRGMGAYSTSHRPTITGGAPNSRQAWGFARVNKFLKKKSGEKVKAAYVQDDDLLESGAILNLSCKDYISKNEAVLKTGYYLDLREFSSINDPYGQIPLNLKHTLVTYNSGNQDGLSLIDTINPISLQKELAEILNIPMNNAHVVVGLYIKMAKKLKSVSDIKSDNIIVMDRDRLVCKSDAGDLFRMGGNINKNNFKMIQQHYQSMKPIGEIQVGDIYLIKEDMFAPHQDHELPQHLSTRYATVEVKSPCHKNLDAYVLEVMDCDCDHVAGKYAKGKIIERSRKHILSSGKLKHAVAKNEPTEFKDGGELDADSQEVKEYFAHDSGNAGGLLVGKRHSEGGIKADVKSTGQRIEMEGGEAVITRGAVNSKKKYVYEGKEMTTREILSDLNVKGGGVAFADGGDVPEKINCGCSSMKVGGVSYTPQDFITLSEKEYQEHRLIDGIEKERNDHFYTLAKLNSGAISIEQALREIASKEMMIDPKYPYSE